MKPLSRNILIAAAGVVGLCILLYFLVVNKQSVRLTTSEGRNEEHGFSNLLPGVKYVGDGECYDCHSKIYDSFKKNGMGRSFYLPSAENMIEDYERNNTVYDAKSNYYYKMFREGDKFYQLEYRTDESGKRTHELMRKIDYIIGSGNHTRSYITGENGFLYEMPVTWYIEKKKWDLSPGYQKKNMRFFQADKPGMLELP